MQSISLLGSGWLGLPLAEYLVQQGYQVNASTRSHARQAVIEAVSAVAFVVDIEALSDNIRAFLNTEILLINITSKNLSAFQHLIAAIEHSRISKVIFISSTSVYKNTNQSVSEDSGAIDHQSPLFQIEELFRHNQSFQTTILRFAGLIGYSRHPGRFFGAREIPQPDAPVNLIHRDDCILIIEQIIQQQVWGEVLNVCSDEHSSKRVFYSAARKSLGFEPPAFEATAKIQFKIIDNSKLKQLLGYQFKHAELVTLFKPSM